MCMNNQAVKSVLVMAGSLKRGYPDVDEDLTLIRALVDSNVPKFLADDLPLFAAIVKVILLVLPVDLSLWPVGSNAHTVSKHEPPSKYSAPGKKALSAQLQKIPQPSIAKTSARRYNPTLNVCICIAV